MAIEPGFIGDNPQGLAYVLPNSRTESYAIQLNQERAAQQRAQAALLLKQQQEANDAYAQHLYANKIPDHNAQWDAVINPAFQQYTQDAAAYHAKTGKDAFAQPEFVQRRNDILSMAAKSNQAAKTAVALSTLLNNDRDNKLNPDDKQRIAQALVAYNADPVKNADMLNGLTASAKPYDITDAQKLLKPTTIGDNNGYFDITKPDRHKHVIQAQDVLADPKFNQLKIKNGINPAVGDAFHITDVNGTHYPTDEPTVRRFVQHILQDPTLPGSAATLQAAGVDPADPNAEQKLTELAMQQNKGYGNLVSSLADYADARAKSDKKRVFGAERLDLANERLELVADRLQMAKDKAAAKGTEINPTYFQDLSERMRTGVPGSGEEFAQLVKNNPAYLRGIHVDNTNPQAVKITIPARYKTDASKTAFNADQKVIPNSDRVKTQDEITYTLDSTNPTQWAAGLGQIYKTVTGESVGSATKALTKAGKGKVPGGLDPSGTPLLNKHRKAASDYGL